MAQAGATALDFNRSILKPGDLMVVPMGNTSVQLPASNQANLIDVVSVPVAERLATWNQKVGAGFYASGYGPLPFAFGAVAPETAAVYVWKSPPATLIQSSK